MGIVSHIEEGKRELVLDVHTFAQLAIRLRDSTKGGVKTQNLRIVSCIKWQC